MKAEGLLRTQSLLGRTWAFEGLCPFQGPSKKVLCSGLGSNLDHRSKRRQTTASLASHAGVFGEGRNTSSPKNACVGGYG